MKVTYKKHYKDRIELVTEEITQREVQNLFSAALSLLKREKDAEAALIEIVEAIVKKSLEK